VILHGGPGALLIGTAQLRQNRRNADSKYAMYHDLLNIVLYATRKNAEDFRRGIEMTLISYAAAVMAKEGAGGPNYELLQNALKAIERKEKSSPVSGAKTPGE